MTSLSVADALSGAVRTATGGACSTCIASDACSCSASAASTLNSPAATSKSSIWPSWAAAAAASTPVTIAERATCLLGMVRFLST